MYGKLKTLPRIIKCNSEIAAIFTKPLTQKAVGEKTYITFMYLYVHVYTCKTVIL